MKNLIRLLSVLMVVLIVAGTFAACNGKTPEGPGEPEGPVWEDLVSGLKLDMSSETAKIVDPDIKQYIDGDTTHFWVDDPFFDNGIYKARYIAINTPESTGQIEEWGKKASNFTKEKLKSAVSIVLESDSDKWEADSTGDRYLTWVWYKTAEDTEYRNLNLEILQEGLAIASSSSQNRYGQTCMKAINQAKAFKLNVYSGEKDPDFYYGSCIELTLKELAANPQNYSNMKVAFEGVVTKNSGQAVYVESFDEETQMYHGMYVYYGFALSGGGLAVIKPGNKVRIVGSLQYYEAGGTWQVADLSYSMMDPKNPNNIQKLGEGFSGAYVETDVETFVNKKVSLTVIDENGEEVIKEFKYAQLALNTTISMKGLKVIDAYTTNNGGKNDGAMTLTCKVGNYTIDVRTSVLKDADGNVITQSTFLNKTIDIRGVVDYYDGRYQIEVSSMSDFIFH